MIEEISENSRTDIIVWSEEGEGSVISEKVREVNASHHLCQAAELGSVTQQLHDVFGRGHHDLVQGVSHAPASPQVLLGNGGTLGGVHVTHAEGILYGRKFCEKKCSIE